MERWGKVQPVELTTSLTGHVTDKTGQIIGDYSGGPGDVISVPVAEAQRMIKNGTARKPESQGVK